MNSSRQPKQDHPMKALNMDFISFIALIFGTVVAENYSCQVIHRQVPNTTSSMRFRRGA
jgi:hypothetical protein